MSLYGALMTGVAGLSANSQALSVASSNIANMNTVGYKDSTATFSTVLAASAGGSDVSSSGVTANVGQNVAMQGLLTSTSTATDLAISGNGFFVVTPNASDTSTLNYTRAGDFTPDANGDLRNSAGYYLLGWQLEPNGEVPSDRNDLTPINVNSLSGKADPTTSITFAANLQSSTAVDSTYTAGDITSGTAQPDFQRTVNIYDSQGGSQPLQVSFVKTGANQWAYEVSYQGDSSNITGANPIATGNISFNTDGTLAGITDTTGGTSTPLTSGTISIGIPWSASSGLAAQTVSLNMGTFGSSDGVTQFDNPSSLISSSVDGALFGSLSGVSIDNNGYVTAQFSNGLTQKIYKLPLATFANPDGLNAITGNAYAASEQSGNSTVSEANTGGAGSISSDALESSTVDLATEFTNLITTQRAYSASSRIITTASNMLDQLLQMSH